MNAVLPRAWCFQAVVVAVNILGIIWIHHDLTRGSGPRLRVLSALPAHDADGADRLTLIFDDALPLGGEPGRGLEQPPFVLEPAVAGQWFWPVADRLEYRLREPLPPGRRFKLVPSPDLERLTGRTLVGPREFKFETRPLRLESCVPTGPDRTHVSLELRFNQPVDPGALLRYVRLQDVAARSLEPRCLTQKPSETITLRVPRGMGDSIGVFVGRGLTGSGGELPLGVDAQHQVQIPLAFTAMRAEVDAPRLEENLTVRVEFSQPLLSEQPVPGVRLEPAVQNVQARIGFGNTLLLEGPFRPGTRYTAHISPDLLSESKDPLRDGGTVACTVPDRQPGLAFAMSSGILAPSGNRTVDLKAVNVPGVRLKARRVHDNNLPSHLRGERLDGTSRELPTRTIPLELTTNTPTTLAVDVGSLTGGARGIFSIEAESTQDDWTSDTVVVAITDLAITAKTERNALVAWVTSLSTARPVAGADLTALTYNGQALGTARTDGDGLARIELPHHRPDGNLWLVTARSGDDVSFLRPDERPRVIEGVDASGRPVPATCDVLLYTERGVYRPGETIHLTGIVRDAIGRVPPAMPLSVTVMRPDGKTVATVPVRCDPQKQGVFHLDHPTAEDVQTGPYRFVVTLPGAAETLGAAMTLVEEFVPVRIDLRAEASSPLFVAGDMLRINAAARYLFDQPCAGLAVKAAGSLQRTSYVSKRYPDYSFHDPAEGDEFSLDELATTLDDEGRAVLELAAPDAEQPGSWRGSAAVTVTEAGGRSVTRHVSLVLDTAERHLGLRLTAGRIVPVGEPATVQWVQVTSRDDDATPAPVAYTLFRVHQEATIEQVDGRYVWKTVEQLTDVLSGEANETGPASSGELSLVCPTAGLHRLRMTDCTTNVGTEIDFYAGGREDSVVLNRPEQLELVPDRERYRPGETASLLVRSPFAGTMLLTVETDRVIERRVMELPDTTLQLDLPVADSIRGGAFVSATVVRAVDPSQPSWRPHRAMGMVRLVTDHADHLLPVALQTPAQARPGTTVTVRVQSASPADLQRPAFVHVWAVDEGVLIPTGYKTPAPLDWFLAPRCSTITTSDIYADLLPDHRRPAGMTRIGADAGKEFPALLEYDAASAGRRSPVSMRRRASAVVWREAIPLGPDGTAALELALPEMRGELRVMAVVVDGDRYGSAHQAITVSAPLLAEMSCPRFAAPGDRFDVPVKIFTTAAEPVLVTLAAESEGGLQASISGGDELRVAPGEPATAWLRVAADGIGPARLRVRASAQTGTETLYAVADCDIPLRPAGPLHTDTRFLRVKAGEPIEIPPSALFVPGTARTNLAIGPRPTLEMGPAVENLLDYPYGCVEQTTSKLYALVYAPELLQGAGSAARVENVRSMIDAGIARLWSMQTQSGGLAYWPGGYGPDLWGTTYAAGWLVEARRAGHVIPGEFLTGLAAYLKSELDSPSDGSVNDSLRAEICRSLAALQKAPQSWMAKLSENVGALDMGARAHLASAWLDLGRKDRALAVLPPETIQHQAILSTSGRITSQTRQEAALLNTLLDLDREHPWIPVLVERLQKARRSGRWSSTLEDATAVAALVRYQSRQGESPAYQGTVRCGASVWPFDHAAVCSLPFANLVQPLAIASSGQGDLCISVTTRGLLRDASKTEYDRGLKVARVWKNRDGEPVKPSALKVGDLVLVETTLVGAALDGNTTLDRIAVVDALAAGLEVENPRLTDASAADALTGGTQPPPTADPDRVEFRDDRVIIFASASAQPRVFRYALRAVTAGSFELPPVQASCMYDEQTASISAGPARRVEIAR